MFRRFQKENTDTVRGMFIENVQALSEGEYTDTVRGMFTDNIQALTSGETNKII
jgi:hypothetical protein